MGYSKHYFPEGFAERLKDLWMKSGMTQEQVAVKIKWKRKAVNAWINGYSMPNALAIARLCRLFNVSADYLLFGEERQNEIHTP